MNIEPYPIKTNNNQEAVIDALDELIDTTDKAINFFNRMGNQHRDFINALNGYRRSLVRLKKGEQE